MGNKKNQPICSPQQKLNVKVLAARGLENNKLRVLSTNARSLVHKIHELEAMMVAEKVDIVAVTETWFNETINWDVTVHFI